MRDTRRQTARLLDALRDRRRPLILTHDNPDPDAIASAMALQALVTAELNVRTKIAYGGIIGRAENKALVDYLGLALMPAGDVVFEDFDGVMLVDTQPGAGNNSLPEDIVPAAVIDHHRPLQEATAQVTFADVQPEYGACSTILVEYLRARQRPIAADLATALFYAIKVDTQDLGRHASRADCAAYMHLFPFVDRPALAKIEYPRLPREYFETIYTAVRSTEVYGTVAMCCLDEVGNPNAIAEVADLMLRLEGVDWSMCLGFYGENLFMSLRTADPDANAHSVIRQAIGRQGSGGGHGMSAGGRIAVAGMQAAERTCVRDGVVRQTLSVLGVADVKPEPLIHREFHMAHGSG